MHGMFLTCITDVEIFRPDVSTPEFPGIYATPTSYRGPRLSPASHPHFQLERSMTSVPIVRPGDMVFWHCDVMHSVEREHTGEGDSSGEFSFCAIILKRKSSREIGVIFSDVYPRCPGDIAKPFVPRASEGELLSWVAATRFPKGTRRKNFRGCSA